MIERHPHPTLGEVVFHGNPLNFAGAEPRARALAPELGEANAEIYGALGIGAEERRGAGREGRHLMLAARAAARPELRARVRRALHLRLRHRDDAGGAALRRARGPRAARRARSASWSRPARPRRSCVQLFGGALADRGSRKRQMVGADALAALRAGRARGAAAHGSASLPVVIALQALVGVSFALHWPAAVGLVPLVVRARAAPAGERAARDREQHGARARRRGRRPARRALRRGHRARRRRRHLRGERAARRRRARAAAGPQRRGEPVRRAARRLARVHRAPLAVDDRAPVHGDDDRLVRRLRGGRTDRGAALARRRARRGARSPPRSASVSSPAASSRCASTSRGRCWPPRSPASAARCLPLLLSHRHRSPGSRRAPSWPASASRSSACCGTPRCHTRVEPAALSRVSAYDVVGSIALVPVGEVLAGFAVEDVRRPRDVALGAVAIVVPTRCSYVPEVRNLVTPQVRHLRNAK